MHNCALTCASDCGSALIGRKHAVAEIDCRGGLCFHKQVLLQIGWAIRAVLLTFLARRVQTSTLEPVNYSERRTKREVIWSLMWVFILCSVYLLWCLLSAEQGGGAYINSSNPPWATVNQTWKCNKFRQCHGLLNQTKQVNKLFPLASAFCLRKASISVYFTKTKGCHLWHPSRCQREGAPLSPSRFLCERCHQIKTAAKSQTEHVFQRGNKGGLTPKHERRRRPRGGVVFIEQWVHMVWQWGCRVLGANDLSGFLDIQTLREGWEREVWLLESGRFHSLVADIKKVRQSPFPVTLHAALSSFCQKGIYVGRSSFHIPVSCATNLFIKPGPRREGWHRPPHLGLTHQSQGVIGIGMDGWRPLTRTSVWSVCYYFLLESHSKRYKETQNNHKVMQTDY